jgi:hypothetical protein
MVGRLKAGEATGPRYGQGGYTELKSVPLGSASPPKWEGRVAEGKLCLVAITELTWAQGLRVAFAW